MTALGRGERSGALDALRGVAITLVVAFHWLGLAYGWIGVDLFFVLSGFLIGGILIDNRHSPNYWQTFYWRRAVRILPLYGVLMAVTLPWTPNAIPAWSYLTFTQNLFEAFTGHEGDAATAVTWSLAVEEQFYLILPAIIRFTSSRTLSRICGAFIVIAPLCRIADAFIYKIAIIPWVLLPYRMDALFWGVLLALAMREPCFVVAARQRRTLIWIAAFVAETLFAACGMVQPLGFSASSTLVWTVGFSAASAGFACVLLGIVTSGWQPSRNFPMCSIGIGAYSIYLFHQPVWSAIVAVTGTTGLTATLLASPAVAAVSVCCWTCIERPLITMARRKWHYGDTRKRVRNSALGHTVILSAASEIG